MSKLIYKKDGTLDMRYKASKEYVASGGSRSGPSHHTTTYSSSNSNYGMNYASSNFSNTSSSTSTFTSKDIKLKINGEINKNSPAVKSGNIRFKTDGSIDKRCSAFRQGKIILNDHDQIDQVAMNITPQKKTNVSSSSIPSYQSTNYTNDNIIFNNNGTVNKNSKAVRNGEIRFTKDGSIDRRSSAVKQNKVELNSNGQINSPKPPDNYDKYSNIAHNSFYMGDSIRFNKDGTINRNSKAVRNGEIKFNLDGTIDKRSSAVVQHKIILNPNGQIDAPDTDYKLDPGFQSYSHKFTAKEIFPLFTDDEIKLNNDGTVNRNSIAVLRGDITFNKDGTIDKRCSAYKKNRIILNSSGQIDYLKMDLIIPEKTSRHHESNNFNSTNNYYTTNNTNYYSNTINNNYSNTTNYYSNNNTNYYSNNNVDNNYYDSNNNDNLSYNNNYYNDNSTNYSNNDDNNNENYNNYNDNNYNDNNYNEDDAVDNESDDDNNYYNADNINNSSCTKDPFESTEEYVPKYEFMTIKPKIIQYENLRPKRQTQNFDDVDEIKYKEREVKIETEEEKNTQEITKDDKKSTKKTSKYELNKKSKNDETKTQEKEKNSDENKKNKISNKTSSFTSSSSSSFGKSKKIKDEYKDQNENNDDNLNLNYKSKNISQTTTTTTESVHNDIFVKKYHRQTRSRREKMKFEQAIKYLIISLIFILSYFIILSFIPLPNEKYYLKKCPKNAICDIKQEGNDVIYKINHCRDGYVKIENNFIQICSPDFYPNLDEYRETLRAASYISKKNGDCLFSREKIDESHLLNLFPKAVPSLLLNDEDFLIVFVDDEFKSVQPQYNSVCRVVKNSSNYMFVLTVIVIVFSSILFAYGIKKLI